MKKNLTLSIPRPCSEKWNHFAPVPGGGFCNSCSKTVIDFSKAGDEEILDFFRNKPTHTCGRFRPDQLRSYVVSATVRINPGFALFKAGLLSLLLILVSRQTHAQNITPNVETIQHFNQDVKEPGLSAANHDVGGVVTAAEDGQPLAGVSIYLKGGSRGTITDLNGRFNFPGKLTEGDVLVFSFIGLDTKEYLISKNTIDKLEIKLAMSCTEMMGEVAVNEVYSENQSGLRRMWGKVKGLF